MRYVNFSYINYFDVISYRIALFLSIEENITSGKTSKEFCDNIELFQRTTYEKLNHRTCSLTIDAAICDLNVVSSSPSMTTGSPRIVECIETEAAISTSITLQDLFAIRMLVTLVVIVDSAFMTLSCKIRILTCKVSIDTVADCR